MDTTVARGSPLAEHERSLSINAPASALFAYLSEVGNLPKYFTRMLTAEPAEGEAVRTSARMPDGQVVEGEAWFRVDDTAQRIEWGSEGPSDYHGWLEVSGDDQASTVQVAIHSTRTTDGEVDQGLEETLGNIKRLVEESNAAPSTT